MVDFNCANVSLCKTVPENQVKAHGIILVMIVDRPLKGTQVPGWGQWGGAQSHIWKLPWSSGENETLESGWWGF